MNRYFRCTASVLNSIREQVMEALEQPNSRASEPWRVDGDFNDGTHGYVALGEHHYTGEFAPLLEQFINTPGVEEIEEGEYRAAMPEQFDGIY